MQWDTFEQSLARELHREMWDVVSEAARAARLGLLMLRDRESGPIEGEGRKGLEGCILDLDKAGLALATMAVAYTVGLGDVPNRGPS